MSQISEQKSNRTFTRIAAVQAIHCLQFRNDIDEVIKNFCSGEILQAGKSKEYAKIDNELFSTLVLNSRNWMKDNRKLISKYINSEWKLDRIGSVDLAILECAITEAKSIQTPMPVLINEYVNTAKSFNVDYRFINGLLHNVSEILSRTESRKLEKKSLNKPAAITELHPVEIHQIDDEINPVEVQQINDEISDINDEISDIDNEMDHKFINDLLHNAEDLLHNTESDLFLTESNVDHKFISDLLHSAESDSWTELKRSEDSQTNVDHKFISDLLDSAEAESDLSWAESRKPEHKDTDNEIV